MSKPPRWTMDALLAADLGRASVTATPSVAARVHAHLKLPALGIRDPFPETLQTWVVVGGGTLLDEAKWRRRQDRPDLMLIAVPSLWGSGAEASPVVVLNREGRKDIHVDGAYVPDVRVVWPELAQSIPLDLARAAAGDVWAHALEALLSPLGADAVKVQLATLVHALARMALTCDPGWFDVSAEACALQAQAGVGLVHGIAHTLEHVARQAFPGEQMGHARLCATYLWPVLCYNQREGRVWAETVSRCNLPAGLIQDRITDLFDAALYRQLLPLLEKHWKAILRDPCTRMNSVLVRPASLSFFATEAFA